MQKWKEGVPDGMGVSGARAGIHGVQGTPESPPPPARPTLNLAPPVHYRALQPLPSSGPPVPATPLIPHPHARIRGHLLAGLPWPPAPPGRRLASTATPRAPSQRQSGTRRARGEREARPGAPQPGAGRGRPQSFPFQSKRNEQKSAPGSPSLRRSRVGLNPAVRPPRPPPAGTHLWVGAQGLGWRPADALGDSEAATGGDEAGVRPSAPESGPRSPARRRRRAGRARAGRGGGGAREAAGSERGRKV